MNEIFNSLTVNTETLTLSNIFLTMLTALAMGLLISYTYYKANKDRSAERNYILTLFMLPVIMSVIILFVGSNIARAFSLAGTVSIIRFRSNAGDAKDIAYIFFAVAAGLTCGIGYYVYGLLFVILLCFVLFLVEKSGYAKEKQPQKLLKITVPEDLNYQDAFKDVLEHYTEKQVLCGVKTADLGSVFQLTYHITLKNNANEKDLIDEIRCRNANLTVNLTLLPSASNA